MKTQAIDCANSAMVAQGDETVCTCVYADGALYLAHGGCPIHDPFLNEMPEWLFWIRQHRFLLILVLLVQGGLTTAFWVGMLLGLGLGA